MASRPAGLRQRPSMDAMAPPALAGESFARLLREWRAFLEAPSRPGADRAAKQATAPIKRVADKRIRRMHRRVLDEGRAITDASPSEELHELRKSCKKLRYLMEFFQSLYPAADIKELIKQMKLLLDNLGGFQDLAVQAAHLRETAAMMQAAGAAPLGTLLAMGALIGHMLEQVRDAGVVPVAATRAYQLAIVEPVFRLTLERSGDVAEAYVSELLLPHIAKGEPARIRIDALGGELFDGHILRIHPTLSETNRQARVEIRFERIPDAARAGQFVRAELSTAAVVEEASKTLHALALQAKHDGAALSLYAEARERVRTLVRIADQVEILDGLAPSSGCSPAAAASADRLSMIRSGAGNTAPLIRWSTKAPAGVSSR